MNKQETIVDIIAEMRSGLLSATVECENCGDEQEQRFTFNGLADRLEAAHKRELSKICPKTGGDFGQLGNAAKLREAVLALKELDFNKEEDCYDFYRIIDAALAEPPRNCDVGTAEEQLKRLHNTICNTTKACPDPDWSCAKCFAVWSQTPYEEGGAK